MPLNVVDAIEWASVLCSHCIKNDWAGRAMNPRQILCSSWTFLHTNYLDDSEGRSYRQLVISSFITTCPLTRHVSCRVFWQNIKSPKCVSSPTAQIWCPATSGFFQNYNHIWQGRYLRLSIRFRKIWQGSSWWMRELCEVPLWKHHCPM